MGKYAEASKYYTEAMACWKRFRANSNTTNNYGTFINMMVRIADLDLPDPFADKKDQKDEPEVAVETVEAVKGIEVNVEPKIEVTSKVTSKPIEEKKTEAFKAEEKKDNYNKYSFRHK